MFKPELDTTPLNMPPEFGGDPMPQSCCCSHWLGRFVRWCCPGGTYSSEVQNNVRLMLGIVGLLSLGTIVISGIWKDSMDHTQKVIVTTVGGLVTFASCVGLLVNECIIGKISK